MSGIVFFDQSVWDAVGFGDLWFPPEFPMSGPDWTAEILTIPCKLPGKENWNAFAVPPPVHRDWNLAMWAAEKAGLFHTDDMNPPHALITLNGAWEVCAINDGFEICECLDARSESGPLAICKAILHRERERRPRK